MYQFTDLQIKRKIDIHTLKVEITMCNSLTKTHVHLRHWAELEANTERQLEFESQGEWASLWLL